jgi:hypothetical protein
MDTKQTFGFFKNLFKAFVTGTILILLIFTIINCEEDSKEGDAPPLPPVESFIIDFSDFDSSDDTVKSTKSAYTYQNWGAAYLKVAFWNTIITVAGIVPVTAFLESFNHQPVYEGDNTWSWTYDYTIGSATYTARLTGKILETEEVKWEMYISKEAPIGGYSNFKWYEGTARFDRTSGQWIVYNNPAQDHELIRIDWNKNWDNNTGDISYTNIIPGDPENGGYIAYGLVEDPVYNAYYEIYNKGRNNLTEIEWNTTTKAGRITDPLTFGDEQWHCWDSLLVDIVCP